jgi:hypothetical protein
MQHIYKEHEKKEILKVFWVVTLCRVVAGYQRFRGPEDGGSMDL